MSMKAHENDTHNDALSAGKREDPAREHVVQHPAQRTQATPHKAEPVVPAPSDAQPESEPLAKTSGRKPGEPSPELGQDSGTAWQESQQMGHTGRGGVENPQTNP